MVFILICVERVKKKTLVKHTCSEFYVFEIQNTKKREYGPKLSRFLKKVWLTAIVNLYTGARAASVLL